MKQEQDVAFLFDLDGVLIDSETEYTKIWTAINNRFNTGHPDLARRIKGMTLENIVATYFKPEDKKAIVDMLYDLEGKMVYNWLPGAKALLGWLKNAGYPTVLVTSSNNKKMEHLREELPELEPLFTHIVTGDLVSKSKPDPEGYLLGSGLAGANPRKCVVFEDSLQGVKAGHASGAYVVGVAGTVEIEKLEPFCDIIVRDLAEIDPDSIVGILKSR